MKYFIFATIPALLALTSASPLGGAPHDKRQKCDNQSSCATVEGTAIKFVTMTGAACPTVSISTDTAPRTTITAHGVHPESCLYPTAINYCQMAQTANLMEPMSSLAVALYNNLPLNHVCGGVTKTANVPTIPPYPCKFTPKLSL